MIVDLAFMVPLSDEQFAQQTAKRMAKVRLGQASMIGCPACGKTDARSVRAQ
jgi:hypothetical protein